MSHPESRTEEFSALLDSKGRDHGRQRPVARKSKAFGWFLCGGLLTFAFFWLLDWRNARSGLSWTTEGKVEPTLAEPILCEAPFLVPTTAPHKNVWRNIPIITATEIRDWLYAPERQLNLTPSHTATESDNSIFLIEAFVPRKSDVLAYIDSDAPEPEKYAHAIINEGSREKIIDYRIGPLPISNRTELVPIRDTFHNPDIPYHAHGLSFNSTALGHLLAQTFGPLADITMDLFGGICQGVPNDTLIGAATAPLSYDGSWRRGWIGMKLNVPGHYLFPLDFYTYFDMSGTDPTKWYARELMYNNQLFSSPEHFRQAWKEGTLKRSKSPPLNDTSGWATRTRVGKGSQRDLDTRLGPRAVHFDGLRFRVDDEEQYITWMGFSFYLGFERDMGLNLWDIRFKDDRIIYELTPQEAMAQYSGLDPRQSSTVYLDRAFGMGAAVKELIVGYDCPDEAVYLPATVHLAGGSSTRLNAICVFERDSGRPLSRHTGWLPDEMGAVKGFELTVRSVSTVGNYDYIFDYGFHLDGTIEIRVSASGYLQGGFWHEEYSPYGHSIRETTMGSLHDHVINFKVDFDVAGQRNSLISAELETEELTEPWLDEDWGNTFTQQRIKRRKIMTENDSLLDYPQNLQGVYLISNEDTKNSWGNSRGYAIHPGANPVHLTNLDCRRTENNVNWAKHHLAISRRHDTEPSSSSMWNIHLPGKPTVDFHKFFDGESLDQEDLVAWINLGTHHIPRAEDSPHTLTNAATSNVMFTPFNFHDFDVSMEALNAVLLNAPKQGLTWQVDTNEIREPHCMPRKPAPLSYTGMINYEEDGSPALTRTVEAQRRIDESWHGLWAEL